MRGHLSLGVSRLNRARDFYGAVLEPPGYVRQWTGARSVEYHEPGRDAHE